MLSKLMMGGSVVSGSAWDSWTGANDGEEKTFDTSTCSPIAIAVLSETSILVAYGDGGNSYYGKATILTNTDGVLTQGGVYTFFASAISSLSCCMLTSTKVIITYTASYSSYVGKAKVATISGTAISYGSEFEFDEDACSSLSMARLTDTTAIIGYRYWLSGSTDSELRACVVTTSSTAGTVETVDIGRTILVDTIALSDTLAGIAYTTGTATHIYTVSISTTTITTGAKATIESASSVAALSIAMLSSTKVLATYSKTYITSRVLTHNGTTFSVGGYTIPKNTKPTYIDSVKISETEALVLFRDNASPYYGLGCVITSAGTTPTHGDVITFHTADTRYISSGLLSATKAIVAYSDYAGSPYEGQAKVIDGSA